MLVRHVVNYSRPASVPATFISFYVSLFFCNKKPFRLRRVCGTALVRGIRFQFLFLTGVFWFFVSGSVTGNRVINRVAGLFMPAAGARPKETRINLMDCICLCALRHRPDVSVFV